jgi:TolA-binding protein
VRQALGWFALLLLCNAHWSWAQSRPDKNARSAATAERMKPKPLTSAKRDSALKTYSIDDLLEYKDLYERQRIRVESERVALREKGIRDMEAFLSNHPESKILDKVIVRLAELYYESELEYYTLSQDQYSKQLELLDAGRLAQAPPEPRKDYSRSLKLYQRVIDEYPQSVFQDDAHYNLAYLKEDMGQREEAVVLYEKFLEQFPESRYLPDALFRLGEYRFNPPRNDLEAAIPIYKRVLFYTESPKYGEALYRLGWCYYKMNHYAEAISYFTLLADDVKRSEQLDPENKITNPALVNESLEYIGISFLEYKGVNGVADYLARLGGRDYGLEILKHVGNIYMTVKEEYDNAVQAFRLLLKLYPLSAEAPVARAKVAESYRALEEEELAYLNRDTLFTDYREGTAWWQANAKEEVRANGRGLAERALRENINLLLRLAETENDASYYQQSVKDSRKYLEAFPKDTTAAQIHWNMALTLDARLHAGEEAYGEYLKISNHYWGSRFQRMAAENAVALAQELAQIDTAQAKPAFLPLSLGQMKDVVEEDESKARKALQLEIIPLAPGEQKLAQALDNYIKLFPHELPTAERLAQAGALHYNKNDFTQALKYFKTLLRHFPESPDFEYAHYLTMESYFGKLDYKSCEIVAKRIRLTGGNPEFLAKAEQRLAESIFLQAEGLANAEQHTRAGEEYRRVYEEVPKAEFADLALFNAGLEFDKAREYRRAVETYTIIKEKFEASPHFLSALNNMAYDYGELEDHLNAAITFELAADRDTSAARAETSLFNASVFSVRATEWERAIRVNRKFVEKYPASKDADDLFYDIANYYLKLSDWDNANAIYGEYAQKFPESPRTVETFYRRGEYYEGRNDLAQARAEYESALAKSSDFKKRELDYNPFFSAEALFRLTDLKYRNFAEIRFRLPKAALDESKERKKNALLEIVDGYTRVTSYGTLRLYEATFKIGLSYEEFAQTWADQEIPEVEDTRRIVAKKEINQTATQLYERALGAYKQGAIALARLAQSYGAPDSSDSTMARDEKVARQDTTLHVAWRWINKSKDKVSEALYDIAELNHESMQNLLSAPAPENLSRLALFEFRSQLLGKFVQPVAAQISRAHQRNIQECDSLRIQSLWMEHSRGKIIETNNALGREYTKLTRQALALYASALEDYKRAVAANDVQMVDLQDEMANAVDFSRNFAKTAVQTFSGTLQEAQKSAIRGEALSATHDEMLAFGFLTSRTFDSLATVAHNERRVFEEKFKQEGRQEAQDAVFALEDQAFALAEGKKELLAAGFEAMRQYAIRNTWSEKITLALVRSDPVKYAGELGLTIADTVLATDTTWQARTTYAAGWTGIAKIRSDWQPAKFISAGIQFSGYNAQRVWASAQIDSLHGAATDSSARAAQPSETAYFHKSFDLRGLPVSAQIQVQADDAYNLFVNGEFIAQQMSTKPDSLETHVHDLGNYLQTGANAIAIEVRDTNRSGGALEAVLFLKTLPGWQQQSETPPKNEAEDETQIFKQ